MPLLGKCKLRFAAPVHDKDNKQPAHPLWFVMGTGLSRVILSKGQTILLTPGHKSNSSYKPQASCSLYSSGMKGERWIWPEKLHTTLIMAGVPETQRIAHPCEHLPYMPALSSPFSHHVRSSLSQTLPNLISAEANSIRVLADRGWGLRTAEPPGHGELCPAAGTENEPPSPPSPKLNFHLS